MRGLEDALARIARRDELLERTSSGRHRVEAPTPAPTTASSPLSPVVEEVAEALRAVVRRNPGVFATVVVQEADTAWSVWIGEWDGTLRTRVTRLESDLPAETAATPETAETAETAATAETAETTIDIRGAAPAPEPAPARVPPARIAAPVPAGVAVTAAAPARAVALVPDPAPAPAHLPPVHANATADRYTGSAAPVGPAEPVNHGDTPTVLPRPVIGPAMNDRVALRIAELLRREAAREMRSAEA
jgi:hypothetical protein